MTGSERVFCGTDLSEAADEAICQAHEWAQRAQVGLTVFHAIPSPLHDHPLLPSRGGLANLPALQRAAIDALSARVESLIGSDNAAIEVEFCEQEPAAAIVTRAEALGASLVVIGSRGASNLVRLLLGGVAERVVRYAHGPVLVARPIRATGHVLCATDLSDSSLPAVAAAAHVARQRGARLTLAHCFESLPAMAAAPEALLVMPPLDEGRRQELRDAALQRLRSASAALAPQAEPVVIDRPAVPGILGLAEESGADLLVVGTRGRTGLARMLLGSTAEGLVRLAPCPVLAVRLAPAEGDA